MQITNVRIKTVDPATNLPGARPLVAVCSVCFDDVFVVHEVKVIGPEPYIVSMPARRLTGHCHNCHRKNPTNHRFCGFCGLPISLTNPPHPDPSKERTRFECDIAHPIDPEFRNYVRDTVREAVKEYFAIRDTQFQQAVSGCINAT